MLIKITLMMFTKAQMQSSKNDSTKVLMIELYITNLSKHYIILLKYLAYLMNSLPFRAKATYLQEH